MPGKRLFEPKFLTLSIPHSCSGNITRPPCTPGSRSTTAITMLLRSAEIFAYARMLGSGHSRIRTLVGSCSAGLSRRKRFRIATSRLMLPGRSQSQTLYSYFSEGSIPRGPGSRVLASS